MIHVLQSLLAGCGNWRRKGKKEKKIAWFSTKGKERKREIERNEKRKEIRKKERKKERTRKESKMKQERRLEFLDDV